ncbi:MAG TPA: phospholipid scramblase-related protein [Gemmataceae bacterium]|nr:phospholipid scramblase-related protein [Gemmataceae bacterium]
MLERNTFVIKEQVKVLSSVQTYDIFDAETGKAIGKAEETIGLFTKALRWVMSKHLLPTRLEVREKPDDSLVFVMRRGWYIFKSRVEVLDPDGELIGYFKSKVFTISGGFHVYDKNDKQFAEVKGKWVGFNYRFVTPDGKLEMGKVSKKLGALGLVKEMFTSADTFAVEIAPEFSDEPMAKMLILAACLAIDMIYKSESRTVDTEDFLGD